MRTAIGFVSCVSFLKSQKLKSILREVLGVLKYETTSKISHAFDFSINYICNQFILAIELFIVGMLILARDKSKKRKQMMVKAKTAINKNSKRNHKIKLKI